jgi:hypothetical protein
MGRLLTVKWLSNSITRVVLFILCVRLVFLALFQLSNDVVSWFRFDIHSKSGHRKRKRYVTSMVHDYSTWSLAWVFLMDTWISLNLPKVVQNRPLCRTVAVQSYHPKHCPISISLGCSFLSYALVDSSERQSSFSLFNLLPLAHCCPVFNVEGLGQALQHRWYLTSESGRTVFNGNYVMSPHHHRLVLKKG